MNSPHDWDVLQSLFGKALRQPAADRAAFLRSQTDDEAIRLEVESLLAAHEEAGSFMEESSLPSGNDSRSDAPRLASGCRLGAFELLERLGAGGMGEVYRARDTRLDRFVAMRVLSPELACPSLRISDGGGAPPRARRLPAQVGQPEYGRGAPAYSDFKNATRSAFSPSVSPRAKNPS